MCSLLLVCAVLRTLHTVKHVLNEEECRRVGVARCWWNELAVTMAVKPPSVVQETLGVLRQDAFSDFAAKLIKSKLCPTAVLVC